VVFSTYGLVLLICCFIDLVQLSYCFVFFLCFFSFIQTVLFAGLELPEFALHGSQFHSKMRKFCERKESFKSNNLCLKGIWRLVFMLAAVWVQRCLHLCLKTKLEANHLNEEHNKTTQKFDINF
jgi:hypothetical protein